MAMLMRHRVLGMGLVRVSALCDMPPFVLQCGDL
jgi:hypothetical protein